MCVLSSQSPGALCETLRGPMTKRDPFNIKHERWVREQRINHQTLAQFYLFDSIILNSSNLLQKGFYFYRIFKFHYALRFYRFVVFSRMFRKQFYKVYLLKMKHMKFWNMFLSLKIHCWFLWYLVYYLVSTVSIKNYLLDITLHWVLHRPCTTGWALQCQFSIISIHCLHIHIISWSICCMPYSECKFYKYLRSQAGSVILSFRNGDPHISRYGTDATWSPQ